ncbi:ABC transporter G family member 11 [Selaginella moellendorffii]|uniref:ABC transporter G family member 11 n=1 Tax=Selaginella moellendorffii TaxID=88036 RepID=UPI000D1C823A|nr:ABC transporter G family member 11 [Selaginella moellendorffii]|eukprot:XP_024530384.1 ABC transporter G family member 11 [Selaginella moellendorffii]
MERAGSDGVIFASKFSTVPAAGDGIGRASTANSNGVGASPLTRTVWRALTKQSNVQDFVAKLTWTDLSVNVLTDKGACRTVLDSLTGFAEPGSLTVVMGPSGCGKSTLLDALAGRLAKNAIQTGDILLNGHKRKLSYGIAAYVTQDDTLISTLTVRETIFYTSRLRLPDAMPNSEKQAIVERVIIEMGLQDCANTPVGNWHLRGLSGGEKRRLSIAVEILTRPRLLFLDEPTSGLDSASAFFVTRTLRRLARDKRTVICSVHQPSSEVFQLFDNLLLLSNGRTVYFGPAVNAQQHFASVGFPCPPMRNPSDHFLKAINADFDRVNESLKESCLPHEDEESADVFETTTTAEVISALLTAYESSEQAQSVMERVEIMTLVKGDFLESSGSQASFWMQCATLTRRSFTNMSRDMGYYWLRVLVYILLAICVGTIFYRVGTSYDSIFARGSCMGYLWGFLTFMAIGGFPSFVEDMKVFHRERLNGHYGVVAFVVGNTLSSIPFLLLMSLTSGAITYYLVQLHPGVTHFLYFVLGLATCVTLVEGLMMAVASVVPNYLMGIIVGAAVQAVLMLTGGFFRLLSDLPKPVWRYPISYLSFHSYVLQGMYQNDFLGIQFDSKYPFLPKINGRDILINNDVDMSRTKWDNLGVLVAMVVGYRLLFFVMIKLSEDVVPHLRALRAKHNAKKATAINSQPDPSFSHA